MNNITVSLETAKKLKEKGRETPTYFVWVEGGKLGQPSHSEIHTTEVMKSRIVLADSAYSLYPAQTAQEILDELPDMIGKCVLTVNKVNTVIENIVCNYGSGYMDRNLKGLHNGKSMAHCGVSLAESCAKLRLRCKENGYLPCKTETKL